METLKSLAPIIGAFIAALLGSFFGALFKEQITDIFFKRKRRRELRSELIQNTLTYFKTLRMYSFNYNYAKVFKYYMNISTGEKRDHNMKLFKEHREESTKLYERLTEVYSKLLYLAFESQSYYPAHKYRQIIKNVEQMQSASDNSVITGFEDLGEKEFIQFKKESSFRERQLKIETELDRLGRHFIAHFNEIVGEKNR